MLIDDNLVGRHVVSCVAAVVVCAVMALVMAAVSVAVECEPVDHTLQ
jgi:hypothetical protein